VPGPPPRGSHRDILVERIRRAEGTDGEGVARSDLRIALPGRRYQYLGRDAGRDDELIAGSAT